MAKPNSTFALENYSLLRTFCEKPWAIFILFFSLLWEAGIDVPIVLIAGTLVYILLPFFLFSLFSILLHSHMHPLNINNWRDNDKNLEQLNGGCPIGYIFGCLLQV